MLLEPLMGPCTAILNSYKTSMGIFYNSAEYIQQSALEEFHQQTKKGIMDKIQEILVILMYFHLNTFWNFHENYHEKLITKNFPRNARVFGKNP